MTCSSRVVVVVTVGIVVVVVIVVVAPNSFPFSCESVVSMGKGESGGQAPRRAYLLSYLLYSPSGPT